MNKRIRKLTPATLKRIIAEEKYRINLQKNKAEKSNKTQLIEAYVKCLSLLKEASKKKNSDLEKINKLTKVFKKKLARSL